MAALDSITASRVTSAELPPLNRCPQLKTAMMDLPFGGENHPAVPQSLPAIPFTAALLHTGVQGQGFHSEIETPHYGEGFLTRHPTLAIRNTIRCAVRAFNQTVRYAAAIRIAASSFPQPSSLKPGECLNLQA